MNILDFPIKGVVWYLYRHLDCKHEWKAVEFNICRTHLNKIECGHYIFIKFQESIKIVYFNFCKEKHVSIFSLVILGDLKYGYKFKQKLVKQNTCNVNMIYVYPVCT